MFHALLSIRSLGEIDAEGIKLCTHCKQTVNIGWWLYARLVALFLPCRKNPTGTCLKSDLLTDGWLAVGLFSGATTHYNLEPECNALLLKSCQCRSSESNSDYYPLQVAVSSAGFQKYNAGVFARAPTEFLAAWANRATTHDLIDGETFIVSMTTGGDSLRYSVSSLIGTGRLDIADDVCREIITIFGGDVENLTLQDVAILLDDVLDWSYVLRLRLPVWRER